MTYWRTFVLYLVGASVPIWGGKVAFEENAGQFADQVRFAARGADLAVLLTDDGALISNAVCGGGVSLRLSPRGTNPGVTVSGEGLLPHTTNYFSGGDPGRWRTGVSSFERVRYADLYPGIDLVFYARGDVFEYDFVLAPGADPERILLRFEGAGQPSLEANGDLLIGELRQKRPVVFQGDGRAVAAEYEIDESGAVRFRLDEFDRTQRLVIDPLLVYAAGFGGSGRLESVSNPWCLWDTPTSIAVDGAGNAFLAGSTPSSDFPLIDGIDGELTGLWDVFVAKLDPSGNLVYSTYIGGKTDDLGTAIAVDPDGNIVVAGRSGCDFPAVNPIFECGADPMDAFVLKLDATGTEILFSTFLGGSSPDAATGIALNAAGDIHVTGTTGSSDFPILPNALQQTPGPGFIAGINAAGTELLYSTYFDAEPAGIALDANGRIFIGGRAESDDMVTTADAVQTEFGGGVEDGFAAALTANASARIYATYLGGELHDRVAGIAVDPTGQAYVTGVTASPNYPTTPGSYQTIKRGDWDAFVTKLSPAGDAMVYSTRLGGAVVDASTSFTAVEQATGIGIDASGHAYITGLTDTLDFPTVRPIQPRPSPGPCRVCARSLVTIACWKAFVAKLGADGSTLVYSTYLGGRNLDIGRAIAVDSKGNAYVAGNGSAGFPWTVAPKSGISWNRVFTVKISDDNSLPPFFTANSAVNAADFVPGLSPGALASLFGTRLVATKETLIADRYPWPFRLGETSVFIDGHPAPFFVAAGLPEWDQLNFQTPSATHEGTVVVSRGGATTAVVGIPVEARQPALFLMFGEQAAAQHASDYAMISATKPARPGEIIILYANALGPPYPAVPDGHPATADPLSATTGEVRLFTEEGVELEVVWAGLTPDLVGVYQINARVPENIPSGNLDVIILMRGQIRSKTAKVWFRR